MAESEGRFSKARLEAFSDGVIAVIITIMVLDLKAPQSAEPAALLKLWPSFAIYLFSFVFIAIYWINHHNLLVAARHVTASLIWANNALLFCLSLMPFATAYVAETDIAPFPTMVYGALQLACRWLFTYSFPPSPPNGGAKANSWQGSGRGRRRTSPVLASTPQGLCSPLSVRSAAWPYSSSSRWPTSCPAWSRTEPSSTRDVAATETKRTSGRSRAP